MANPKRKGDRLERELVHAHRKLGVEAARSTLPYQAGGEDPEVDLVLTGPAIGRLVAQVKGRGDGFRRLYAWLGDLGALFIRADRQPWLVVLPWPTWERIHQNHGPNGESIPRDTAVHAVRQAAALTAARLGRKLTREDLEAILDRVLVHL